MIICTEAHHPDHVHQHGPNCGHTAIRHDAHVDYLYGGHLHYMHRDHVDEHMTPAQKIPVGPSYQVPLARAVKAATNLPTVAVGLIAGYDQAEAIVGTGDADFVALARIILYDPRWPWHAAAHLGATVKAPKQYLRSQPSRHRHLFDD